MDSSTGAILGGLAAVGAGLFLLGYIARTIWLIRRYGAAPWLRATFSMDPENGRLLGILFLLLAAFIAMRRWNGVDGHWFSFW